MNKFAIIVTAAMNIATVGTATVTAGCTPTQQAVATQIENVVLADLAANKSLEQIETDVAAIVIPGNAGADIVAIVNEAIQFLIDLGVISGALVPKAQAMQTALAAKHAQGLKR